MKRAVVLGVLMLGGNALACSCRTITSFFPPSGSTVPTNAEFQVTQTVGPVPPLTLVVEGSGVVLEVDVVTRHAAWLSVRPRTKLTPGTMVRLSTTNSDGLEAQATWVVGSAADETPPLPRALTGTARTFIGRPGSSCGNSESVQLTIDPPTSDDPSALFVFAGPDDVSVASAALPSGFTEDGLLGDSTCFFNFGLQAVPDLALGVRAVDFAGNLSELSNVKQAKTAGCSAAPGVLGVVAVVLLRRRRAP